MAKIINQSRITSKYTLPDQTEMESEVKSNTTITENMTSAFQKARYSNKNFGEPNEEIMQTITLHNGSDYPISNIKITDTIGSGVSFKQGSVEIDNTKFENYNIVDGITLSSDLQPNDEIDISYYIIVDSAPTVASAEIFSTIEYTVQNETFSEQTNTSEIQISVGKISITKSVDKQVAISGDHLKFTHILKNEGNLSFTDIMFYDPLPQGIIFVNDSVRINNKVMAGYNPISGFSVEDISPNQEITITFEVEVE